jgi:hypothetical protein
MPKTFEEWILTVNPETLDILKQDSTFKFCKQNLYKKFGVSQKMLEKITKYFNYEIVPLTKSKKLTTEEWILKASKKHNNFYDYSLSVYVNNNTKIKIVCPLHGEFKQAPNAHSDRGDGCPKCGLESRAKINRTTKEDFIQRSNEIHNFKFDYSLVHDFKRLEEYLTIICPIHGKYTQNGHSHIRGSDCEKCSYEKRGVDYSISKEDMLKRFQEFNNNLIYDLSDYNNTNSVISYFCEIHGNIKQRAQKHLRGKQCSKCAKKVSWNTGNTEKFIEKAREVHGDKYDYSKVNYKNNRIKVEILCEYHGSFFQRPNNHVDSNGGCPICAKIMSSYRKDLTENEIETSKEIKCLLYVMEFSNDTEKFWILGISSNYKKRKKDLLKQSGYEIKDVSVLIWNVFDCVSLEQYMIYKYKKYKYKPLNYFQGHTECFSVNPYTNFEEFETLNYKIPINLKNI